MRIAPFALVVCVLLIGAKTAAAQRDAGASFPSRVLVRVVDESGAPVVGALITASTEISHREAGTTDALGELVVGVPPGVAVRLVASRDDYGLQHTDMNWTAWSRYDVVTTSTLTLVLRRGVVVHGRLVDASGQPRPHERLMLIPAYIGSGPFTLDTTTDANGGFSFPRAVLDQLEVVAGSIDEWHPEIGSHAGQHLRVRPLASAWLPHADQPITLTVETYELIAVTLDLSVPRTSMELWQRGGPREYIGTVQRTDVHGRTVIVMERGLPYELWAMHERPTRTVPWSQGIAPVWTGRVERATTLPIALP